MNATMTFPCGCTITRASVLSMCLMHDAEMREAERVIEARHKEWQDLTETAERAALEGSK